MRAYTYRPGRESQLLDVIIPTVSRLDTLPLLLASLAQQDFQDFNVFILDQHPESILQDPATANAVDILRRNGVCVAIERAVQSWQKYGDYRIASFRLGSASLILMLDEDIVLTNAACVRALVDDAKEYPAAFHAFDTMADAGGLEQHAPLPIWLRPRVVYGVTGGCVLLRRCLVGCDDVAEFFAHMYSHGDDLLYSCLTALHGPGRIVGFASAHMVDGNVRVHPTWTGLTDASSKFHSMRLLWESALVYGLDRHDFLPEPFYWSSEARHVRRFLGVLDDFMPPATTEQPAVTAVGNDGRDTAASMIARWPADQRDGLPSYEERYVEATALATEPTAEAVDRLLELLQSEHSSLKATVARLLAGIGPAFPSIRDTARRLLKDVDGCSWYTRICAAHLLSWSGLTQEDTELFIDLLDSRDECLASETLIALARCNTDTTRAALGKALDDHALSPKRQARLIDALGVTARAGSHPEVGNCLRSTHDEVRSAALRNWRLVSARASGEYSEALASEDPRDRVSCLWAAPFLRSEDTAEQLLSVLATSTNPHELRLAVDALREKPMLEHVIGDVPLSQAMRTRCLSLLAQNQPWCIRRPVILLLMQVDPAAMSLDEILRLSDPKLLRNYDYYREVVLAKIDEMLPTMRALFANVGRGMTPESFNLLYICLDFLLDHKHTVAVARRTAVAVIEDDLCRAVQAAGLAWIHERFRQAEDELERTFWLGWLGFAQRHAKTATLEDVAALLEEMVRSEPPALGLLALELLAAEDRVRCGRLLERYADSDELWLALGVGKLAMRIASRVGHITLPASWARRLSACEDSPILQALGIRYGASIGAFDNSQLGEMSSRATCWSIRREVHLARAQLLSQPQRVQMTVPD